MQTLSPLALWAAKQGMSQIRLAHELRTSESHLSNFLNGRRGISLDLAVRIERLTKGAIPAASLFTDKEAAE